MPLLSPVPRRYVLLVVGDPGAAFSTRLERAELAAEVVPCPSPEGAWSALASGRRYSAVVAPHVDPDLAQAAAQAGTPVLTMGPEWGAAELAAAVSAVARPVPRADQPPDLGPTRRPCSPPHGPGGDGRLVAVCGPGGTGASTIAAALASELGPELGPELGSPTRLTPAPLARPPSPPAPGRPTAAPPVGRRAAGVAPLAVLLADLARPADQAFLHGLGEPESGLLPLVESARYRPLRAVDAHRYTVPLAGWRLLPGLSRPGHWTAVRPAAFDNALMGLLGLFGLLVADLTGDFEGERETGSVDIEERNHLGRATAGAADVVVAVGVPGPNGSRRLAMVINQLLDLGLDPARIQPVINQTAVPDPGIRVCGLPATAVELPLLPGARPRLLPPQVARPVVIAVADLLARLPAPDRTPALVPVTPGSLGCVTR